MVSSYLRYSPVELPSLFDSCSSSVAVASSGLSLLSTPCSGVSSGDCDSEDGCSSVRDGSVVASGLVEGACCESIVMGVSEVVSVVVVAGSAAGGGSCWTVLETVGVSDCVRSALTGVYAVCSGLHCYQLKHRFEHFVSRQLLV